MSVRGYQVGISFSGSGDYTGPLEDVSSYVEKDANVVATWGRSDPWTSADMTAGKLTFTLLNHKRYFSPENGSSPIAGQPITGAPGRLTDSGTTIFSGEVDEYDLTTSRADKTIEVTCSDGWTKPGDIQLSTAVYSGMRTGDLINVVLDAVGWPAAARDIDPGVTLVPYWWADGIDAKTAVTDLVHSEGIPAVTYLHQGIFVFRDRHHRLTDTASLTSQGLYTQNFPAGAIGTDHKILKDSFNYSHGLDRIVNAATLAVTPRLPSAETVVWSTDDVLALSPAEVRQFIIHTDTGFVNMQVPSAITPYITDQGSTYDYVLDAGAVSFALSRTSGQTATLTMTAGGAGAFISTGLRVRATPLNAGATLQFTAADATSQAKYGTTQWPGEAPWAYYYDAQAIVDQVVATYSYPAPSVTFQIEGRLSAGTQTRILAAEISDRITVKNDEMGLNADFHIEQLGHSVQQLGVKHTQTIGAQVAPGVQATNPFLFDVSGAGFDQGQFSAYAGNNPASMFRFDDASRGFNVGVFAT